MKKILWIILNIFTFGGAYFYIKSKGKSIQENKEITTSKKLNFSINDLIEDLGGVQNIVAINNTISTIKVALKDTSKIKNEFKRYGISGIVKDSKGISLVSGDNAQTIKEQIEKKLGSTKF